MTKDERISELQRQVAALEAMVDNAHEALTAVRVSGVDLPDDVLAMIDRGLDSQPQPSHVRLS